MSPYTIGEMSKPDELVPLVFSLEVSASDKLRSC